MHRRAFLTTTVTGAVAAGIAVLAAAPASAHQCFVVNRSDQGSRGAAKSGVWFYATIDEAFDIAAEITGGPSLTPAQLDWAVAEAGARGLPASLAINGKHTIPVGEGAGQEGKEGDGKGIDHFFDAYGDELIAIYLEALEH